MEPVTFDAQNKVLQSPIGMDNCDPLPVFTDGEVVISCWQLSPEEIVKISVTGILWVSLRSGSSQPPIGLTVDNPFS